MRHMIVLITISLTLSCTVVVQAPPNAPPGGSSEQSTGVALTERIAMLEPIQVESLTLTPIIATQGTRDDVLLVLDEAMASGKVKIREIAGGTVNSLTFVNSAEYPVFVMAGEVILGGKQDRIIGRNTVIPANTTQSVPVFCVEHGRWDGNGQNKQFVTGKALAHGRLRGKASYAAQQDVWNEVSAKNQARGTTNSSDTYRRVAQQQSDGTLAGMEKEVEAALARIPAVDRKRMVGFAVALNGAVATVDVFGSPALFRKLETKLVRSYLTEAIDVAAEPGARAPSVADIRAFMADANKAPEQKSYDTDAAATTVKSGSNSSNSTVEYKRRADQPNAASEPAVYENYQVH
jgi:hypothetical protein